MIDLDDLERLAKAATPDGLNANDSSADWAYISATLPPKILKLIAAYRVLRAELENYGDGPGDEYDSEPAKEALAQAERILKGGE